jgi:hypothetical protein
MLNRRQKAIGILAIALALPVFADETSVSRPLAGNAIELKPLSTAPISMHMKRELIRERSVAGTNRKVEAPSRSRPRWSGWSLRNRSSPPGALPVKKSWGVPDQIVA